MTCTRNTYKSWLIFREFISHIPLLTGRKQCTSIRASLCRLRVTLTKLATKVQARTTGARIDRRRFLQIACGVAVPFFNTTPILRHLRSSQSAAVAGATGQEVAAGTSSTALPVYGTPQLLLEVSETGIADITTAVDLNRGGVMDVVIARQIFASPQTFELGILLNNGHGGIVDATHSIFSGPVPQVQQSGRIVVADFNGDGYPDIFIPDFGQDMPGGATHTPGRQNTLVLSAPGGTLIDATANLPQQSDVTNSATAADFDGDGTIDLFVGNVCGCDRPSPILPEVWLNDGTGHFTNAADSLPSDVTDFSLNQFHNQYTASCVVDVNNDGAPDLILGGSGTPSKDVMNDGVGHFSVWQQLPLPPFGFDIALDIRSGDLNRDGYSDILIVYTKSNPFYAGRYIQVLINNGDGTFRDETPVRLPQGDNGDPWIKFLELIDIDGDGNLDLATKLVTGAHEQPPFYLNDGNGFFTPLPGFANLSNGNFVNLYVPVDIQGNGHRDFIATVGAYNGAPERHYLVPDVGPVLRPGIPQGVAASHGAYADRVRVTWEYVWGATSYEVWRSPNPESTGSLVGTTKTMVFDDTTAPQGQISYYSVRAGNDAGLSSYSRADPGCLRSSIPLVGLGFNKKTFGPGDNLRLEVTLANRGPAVRVDMYLGVLVPTSLGSALGCPAGDGIVFFADGATTVVVRCLSSPPQSFAPLLQDELVSLPFKVFPNLLVFQWPMGLPAGAYVFFVVLTRPGAFANGTVNPNDLIAVATDSVGFSG